MLTAHGGVVAGRVIWGDHDIPGPGGGGELAGPLATVASSSYLPGCRTGQI